MKIDKEKLSKYFLISIGVFIVFAFLYGEFVTKPDIEKNGVWVIAVPYSTEGGGKGGSTYIKFKYLFENREYKNKENGFQGRVQKILSNRYLIKISSKKPTLCYFTDDYPVPDSIKEAPPEGWKKIPEWAKQE